MKIYIRAFLFLLSALVLSSCIDMQRKIRLNSDGSGSEKLTISINRNSLLAIQIVLSKINTNTDIITNDIKEVLNMFNDTLYLAEIRAPLLKPGVADSIKLISVKEISSTDSAKSVEIYYSFKSPKNLIDDKLSLMYDAIIPDETKKKNFPVDFIAKEDYCEFSYIMGFRSDKDTMDLPTDTIDEVICGNRSISFEIRTENDIISSNADSWKGKKAFWKIPLIDHIRKQHELYLKFEN
ncbi:MAG: hypothetical protein ABI543_09825 [Ignavibacteria bacterium]